MKGEDANISDLTECPLCSHKQSSSFFKEGVKNYFKCKICNMRFLSPDGFLPRNQEYEHYQTHENDREDPGYRKFLSKLSAPLSKKLSKKCIGLDYGCGPEPALADMMEEMGHKMSLFDPFYFPDTNSLEHSYDFIVCTETVEHFHRPFEEFNKLVSLLKPGGWLAIMTCFQTEDHLFPSWRYRKDPTHVCFYRPETFEWVARKFGLTCEIPVKDVVLMQKKSRD